MTGPQRADMEPSTNGRTGTAHQDTLDPGNEIQDPSQLQTRLPAQLSWVKVKLVGSSKSQQGHYWDNWGQHSREW